MMHRTGTNREGKSRGNRLTQVHLQNGVCVCMLIISAKYNVDIIVLEVVYGRQMS